MAANSAIEWTDHTWNCWWGCVRVSPACQHCYAETWARRYGYEWGPQARRRFFGQKHWDEPLKWNRDAEKAGARKRVFCASMADVFELLPQQHPDAEQMSTERCRLWQLIEATPNLTWLLLTKRPENVLGMTPNGWGTHSGWPENVWLGTTVETQEYADTRIPHLLECAAAVRFLSIEPLLAPVDLRHVQHPEGLYEVDALTGNHGVIRPHRGRSEQRIHWVIVGGESGIHARPTHLEWVRDLRDQCRKARVPFFFKQWGCWCPGYTTDWEYWTKLQNGEQWAHGVKDHVWPDKCRAVYLGKKRAGRLLDGKEWSQFPGVAT